jgi:hypothetical protein
MISNNKQTKKGQVHQQQAKKEQINNLLRKRMVCSVICSKQDKEKQDKEKVVNFKGKVEKERRGCGILQQKGKVINQYQKDQ